MKAPYKVRYTCLEVRRLEMAKKSSAGKRVKKRSACASGATSRTVVGKGIKSSFLRDGVRILRPPGEPSFDYDKYVEAARVLRRKSAA